MSRAIDGLGLVLLSCLWSTCVLAAADATAEEALPGERRATVLMVGKAAGTETYVQQGDEHIARFSYNDRGRGPSVEARWRLDARQIPVRLKITGSDYLKAPVDEWYANERGVANWKSAAEQGSMAGAHEHFYAPIEAPPMFAGVLARALLADGDGEISLLPAGTARISEALTIPEPGSKSRRKRELVAYEVSGLGFAPELVWFDADGAYLGVVSEWMSVLPEGREAWLAPMLAAQSKRESTRSAGWAKQLTQRPSKAQVISGARVFDPRTGRADAASVVVVGNRIVAVGDEARMRLPEPFDRIDATGKFVMPGLWDNHVHLGGVDGVLHLAAGVTSVRDMANDQESLPARVARFNADEELGPRVLMAGFMDGRGPFAGPTKVFVDTPEEAEQWVDWYADHGYVQIKVYSSLKPALVPLIARLAHERGMRLSGHVPAFMSAEQFIAAGADELQHLNFVFLNFLTKEAPDTRDMTRFTAIGRHAAGIDPTGERELKFIDTMVAHNTVLDGTVNIFEGFFEARSGEVHPGYKNVADRLPPQVRRGLLLGGLRPPVGDEDHYQRAFASMLRFLAAVHEAGVPIIPGTDGLAGFALQRELELYAAAGIPIADVLRMATLGSAEANRKAHELGVIAPGWLADLIVIEGDPLTDISDIRQVRQIMKDGRLYDATALHAIVGVTAGK